MEGLALHQAGHEVVLAAMDLVGTFDLVLLEAVLKPGVPWICTQTLNPKPPQVHQHEDSKKGLKGSLKGFHACLGKAYTGSWEERREGEPGFTQLSGIISARLGSLQFELELAKGA